MCLGPLLCVFPLLKFSSKTLSAGVAIIILLKGRVLITSPKDPTDRLVNSFVCT